MGGGSPAHRVTSQRRHSRFLVVDGEADEVPVVRGPVPVPGDDDPVLPRGGGGEVQDVTFTWGRGTPVRDSDLRPPLPRARGLTTALSPVPAKPLFECLCDSTVSTKDSNTALQGLQGARSFVFVYSGPWM